MLKKLTLSVILLLLAACGPRPTSGPSTPSADQVKLEEQAVYTALFKDMFNAPMVVLMEQTSTDPGGVENTASTVDSVMKDLPGIDKATVENFKARNDQAYALSPEMNVGVKYVLLSQAEMNKFFGINQDGWQAFYQNYPDAPGITSVSRVGFNSTYDQALVYIGTMSHYLAGAGYYALMVKVNGVWALSIKTMTWIS